MPTPNHITALSRENNAKNLQIWVQLGMDQPFGRIDLEWEDKDMKLYEYSNGLFFMPTAAGWRRRIDAAERANRCWHWHAHSKGNLSKRFRREEKESTWVYDSSEFRRSGSQLKTEKTGPTVQRCRALGQSLHHQDLRSSRGTQGSSTTASQHLQSSQRIDLPWEILLCPYRSDPTTTSTESGRKCRSGLFSRDFIRRVHCGFSSYTSWEQPWWWIAGSTMARYLSYGESR